MPTATSVATAIDLMDRFAVRTGLEGDAAPTRYLWTDAFAACNFHALASQGAGDRFGRLALRTVEQVHVQLAHFRVDDDRSGWLRGPHGTADDQHPTRAGLRIGKPLPERGAGDRFDEDLEWERDGQYFHYLTRWMHALDQLVRNGAGRHYGAWARELADVAHRAFTHEAGGRKRMYWKMSTDLSRPLVPSMGQHDPLDGLVGALALRSTAHAHGDADTPDLDAAVDDYAAMLDPDALATADPLGVGGLLMDAFRLQQLMRQGLPGYEPLFGQMLEGAMVGLRHCRLAVDAPARTRLGFRELGLAIGLAAIERMHAEASADRRVDELLAHLQAHLPLRTAINGFWLDRSNRGAETWIAHRDINEVMLATSLAPEGWLVLTEPAAG